MADEPEEQRSVLVSCGTCSAAFGRLGDAGQEALIDAHYLTCTDYLRGEGLIKIRPLCYAFEFCRCGREIRKLNAANDDPKCTGCGYPEEVCRCLAIGGVVANPYIVGESGPEVFNA